MRPAPGTVLTLAAAVLVAALAAPPVGAAPALVEVGTFDRPVYVAGAPGDSTRVFVVERDGRVRLVKDGVVATAPFLDISSIVDAAGEGGLLSIAFAPDYATSRRLYALYTDATAIRIAEFVAMSDDQASTTNGRVLLTQPHSAARGHYAGQLQFGPDGYLYAAIGDGSDGGDNALNVGTLWGKILRIDPRPSGAAAYQIPVDNPFVGLLGPRLEIWAYGLRNPWRFSFDRQTGDLVIGDVGQDRADEVDFVPRTGGGGRGANFGWNCFEGLEPYQPAEALRNEVLNPSFESDTAHWAPWGGAQLGRASGGARYGDSAARLLGTAGGNWLAFSDAASGADVAPGERAFLRASVKRVAGPEPQSVLLVARWYTAAGGLAGGTIVTRRVGTTVGAWHELAGELVVPSGVAFASVQVQFTGAVVGNEFQLDGVQALRLGGGEPQPGYLDGSLPNGRWEGTPHDSRSFEVGEATSSGAHVPPVLEKLLPTEGIGGWCNYSLTGGYVVRDASVPSLNGRYLYGDFCRGELRSVLLATPAASDDQATGLSLPVTSLVSFGEDAIGHVYVVSMGGPVYRVVEAPSP